MTDQPRATIRQRLGFAAVVAVLVWAAATDLALFVAGLLILGGLGLAALAYIAVRAQRIDRKLRTAVDREHDRLHGRPPTR